MTDQGEIFEAIRSRFATEIGTGQSIDVVYDNGPEPASIRQSWCRFTVQVDNQEQISMGTVRYRMTGIATARLFTPIVSASSHSTAAQVRPRALAISTMSVR